MASASPKPSEQEKPSNAAQPSADKQQHQKTAALGEDDEFEDFPIDGMCRPLVAQI